MDFQAAVDSAVTKLYQRFEQKIEKDRELSKRIESIKGNLSNARD